MIEQFAALYVHVIEPLFQSLGVILAILTVLWVLVLINDAQKGKDLIHKLFEMIWKSIFGTFVFLFLSIKWVWRTTVSIFVVSFSAVRDFLTGKV